MRWFWIDRFVTFTRGTRAVAIKNVTASEPAVEEYMPGFPIFPNSLIVEGVAQTGGLLVGEFDEFRQRVVLAKISRARFYFPARPGDQLTYSVDVADIKSDGAVVHGQVHRGEQLQAEIDLIFAHLDERFPDELFDPGDLLIMVRLFGLYDVGVDQQGRPLVPPQVMAEAEKNG